MLRPMEAGISTIGSDADDKGTFSIQQIVPGRYMLVAERDGYLPSSTCLRGALRMPPVITIGAGQSITNLSFRLRPWAVIGGRIKFEDGEPAVSARVEVYREYYLKGRHSYQVAATSRTNDRGDYRVFGLAPGTYIVAVTYDRSVPASSYIQQARRDADGRELPVFGFATTFHPATTKLTEAVPIRLEYGLEQPGIDLFLKVVRKVKLAGRVTSAVSGKQITSPAIALARLDAGNNGTLMAAVNARYLPGGFFEIRDVTPGQYLLQATGSEGNAALTGRIPVTVSDQDVENVELLIAAEQNWGATFRVEGAERLPFAARAMRVTLEPRSQHGPVVNADASASGFRCRVRPEEHYDLFVDNLPDDYYVAAIRVSGSDAMVTGAAGYNASPDRPIDVVLDARGGRVGGRVFGPDGAVWSGASLALVPDPPQGRLQSYRTGVADEYGQFQIRGVPPGRYTLIAWLDDPPCDVYDPSGLEACRATGMAVWVEQAGSLSLQFNARQLQRR